MFNYRPNLNRFTYLLLGLAVFAYLRSVILGLQHGGPITDDEIDLIGALQHLDIYTQIFQGDARKINVIHDLGFYGQFYKFIYLIPFYLILFVSNSSLSLNKTISDLTKVYFTSPDKLTSNILDHPIEPINSVYTGLHILSIGYLLLLLVASAVLAHLLQPRSKLSIPLTLILMLTTPQITGISLFNSKDIPIAFFYTAFTLCLTLQVSKRTLWLPPRLKYLVIVLSGSILSSLKLVFLPVIAITILFVDAGLLLRSVQSSQLSIQQCRQAISRLLTKILPIIILSTLFNPYILANPIPRAASALKLYSNHTNSVEMLFKGELVSASSSSWNTLKYLFDWFTATTPIYLIVLSLICLPALLISCLTQRHLNAVDNNLIYLPILLQCLMLPFVAVLNNSNTYDALRHWTFALVANNIVVSSYLATSLPILFLRPRLSSSLTVFIVGLLALLPILDTITLAPYQYTYKNEISRSHPNGPYSDGDYWLFGARQLLTIMNNDGLNVKRFDGSSWDYARIWTRYLNRQFDPDGYDVILFDRGSKLSRKSSYSCKTNYILQSKYFFSLSHDLPSAGISCVPRSDSPIHR